MGSNLGCWQAIGLLSLNAGKLCTPLLRFRMDMRPPTVLLKRPMVPEDFVSILKSNRKHFVYVTNMSKCTVLENDQRRKSLGTHRKLDHYFLWVLLPSLDATFCISFHTISSPNSFFSRIIDSVYVEHLFIGEENFHRILLSETSSYPVCESFSALLVWISERQLNCQFVRFEFHILFEYFPNSSF